ncbi:hypothetical protein Anapl_12615 [Anas platyrhynchos]|uniref:Uncharacterized protein n=1 Tax=Anas platyrhynchos TaxID=8839 RepID=R0LW82_ANAPL|nr:hypothetical protein Anapl_12615 [Anas platyrhynchos]
MQAADMNHEVCQSPSADPRTVHVLCPVPTVEPELGKLMNLHPSTHRKEKAKCVPPLLMHLFPGNESEFPQTKVGTGVSSLMNLPQLAMLLLYKPSALPETLQDPTDFHIGLADTGEFQQTQSASQLHGEKFFLVPDLMLSTMVAFSAHIESFVEAL